MNSHIKKRLIIKYFLILSFIIIMFTINDLFKKVYVILKNSYEARLESHYGYCNKQGYGFIMQYSKKYNLKNNVKFIYNNQKFPYPGWFLDQFDEPKKYDFIIIVNSKKNKYKKKILEQEYNCFLLKND